MVAPVEKAIRDADLGLNPSTNGDLIRVPMPMLTEERRRDLIKVVKSRRRKTPRWRCAIYAAMPMSTLKELLKDKEIGEDDERRAQDEIQKLTDRFVVEIDKALASQRSRSDGGLRSGGS